jgi:hypothetical protein
MSVDNPFLTPAGDANYEMIPAGNHHGVLVGVVDIGTHDEEFQGVFKTLRKICFIWELVTEKDSRGKNHVLGHTFTLSGSSKSTLRQLLAKWRGKDFTDGEQMNPVAPLGHGCLVAINEAVNAKGKKVAKFGGISPLPKGMPAIQPSHQPFSWHISSNTPFPDADWFPYIYGKKIADLIASSYEVQGLDPSKSARPQPVGAAASHGSEIPF